MRRSRQFGFVLSLAALALGAVSPAAAAADPVRIGVLGSFSGPYADWGKHFRRGVDLFLAQNGSTADGHPVQVVYRDVGGNNPARAKQLAQELVVRDRVQYLAGLDFTPTVLATREVLREAKLPLVIFNAATSEVVRKSPWYIRVGFTQWEVAIPLATYAAGQGKRRAVIIAADYAPGYDAIASFTKGFTDRGGTIADVIKVPLDTPDMASYFQRIHDDAPDALYGFMPLGPMTVALVKGFVDRGLAAAGVQLYGTSETEESVLPALGRAALGIVTAMHYGPTLDNPENRAFVAAYQARYGTGALPNFQDVAAYDGMRVIFHMIAATGGRPDGAKAMAAARGFAWASPRGPVSIDPAERDIIQNIYIRKVEMIGGKLGNGVVFTYPQVKDPWLAAHPE